MPAQIPNIVSSLSEASSPYDAILCDVWGVLHDGTRAFPAASDALAIPRERRRCGAITNAPRPSPPVRAQMLQARRLARRFRRRRDLGRRDDGVGRSARRGAAAPYRSGPRSEPVRRDRSADRQASAPRRARGGDLRALHGVGARRRRDARGLRAAPGRARRARAPFHLRQSRSGHSSRRRTRLLRGRFGGSLCGSRRGRDLRRQAARADLRSGARAPAPRRSAVRQPACWRSATDFAPTCLAHAGKVSTRCSWRPAFTATRRWPQARSTRRGSRGCLRKRVLPRRRRSRRCGRAPPLREICGFRCAIDAGSCVLRRFGARISRALSEETPERRVLHARFQCLACEKGAAAPGGRGQAAMSVSDERPAPGTARVSRALEDASLRWRCPTFGSAARAGGTPAVPARAPPCADLRGRLEEVRCMVDLSVAILKNRNIAA